MTSFVMSYWKSINRLPIASHQLSSSVDWTLVYDVGVTAAPVHSMGSMPDILRCLSLEFRFDATWPRLMGWRGVIGQTILRVYDHSRTQELMGWLLRVKQGARRSQQLSNWKQLKTKQLFYHIVERRYTNVGTQSWWEKQNREIRSLNQHTCMQTSNH